MYFLCLTHRSSALNVGFQVHLGDPLKTGHRLDATYATIEPIPTDPSVRWAQLLPPRRPIFVDTAAVRARGVHGRKPLLQLRRSRGPDQVRGPGANGKLLATGDTASRCTARVLRVSGRDREEQRGRSVRRPAPAQADVPDAAVGGFDRFTSAGGWRA